MASNVLVHWQAVWDVCCQDGRRLRCLSATLCPTRPVVCLDEASKELHDLPRGRLPVEQGQPLRQDDAYERHGVANLLLMIEPLRGWRKVRVTERRTRCDCAEQLRLLSDEDDPQAERIVLVVDNLNTHGPEIGRAHV